MYVLFFTAPDFWYQDLAHYLQEELLLEHWSFKQRRAPRLKSASYQIVEGILVKKNYDGVLLRCLEKEDARKVMIELHDGPAGGHFFGDTTTHKILRAGYYWTTVFKDAHADMSESAISAKGVEEDKLNQ